MAFLSDPGSYAPPVATVERIDTHGAHVFLAGDKAIKIKRSVRYMYMDFSTLALRRNAIERELAVNKEAAPEIYEKVVPLTQLPDGQLRLGGRDEPVEWALVMRRFDQSDLLSQKLAAGPLPVELVKLLADAVFQSHARARVIGATDGVQGVRAVVDELDEAFRCADGVLGEPTRFGQLARAQLERVAGLLTRRARAGYVRRCHGDLHLNNLVVWRGRPVLFDAIEFDEDLASIDTLYDLAFLLMDLHIRGARSAANVVLNNYLRRTEATLDLEGLAALPLFLGLRAGVRAMIGMQRASLSTEGVRQGHEQEAVEYYDAALEFLATVPPVLLAIGGYSGSGKSTAAARSGALARSATRSRALPQRPRTQSAIRRRGDRTASCGRVFDRRQHSGLRGDA